MGKYETNYEVPPVSRKNLRVFAKLLRDSFGIMTIIFPVIEFLEALDGFWSLLRHCGRLQNGISVLA